MMGNKRKRLQSEVDNFLGEMPDFNYDQESQSLKGDYLVLDDEGKYVDSYPLIIRLTADYPFAPPEVFDDGKNEPYSSDRHIEENGKFCLFYADESWKYYSPDDGLIKFLHGPVREFLVLQKAYEIEGRWEGPGRAHYQKGCFEFYKDEFGVTDPRKIHSLMKQVIKRKIKGGNICPICYPEATTRIRNCHPELLEFQKRASIPLMKGSIKKLETHCQNNRMPYTY
ncbi:hypothetical protein GF354_01525 [Candidatus Peregrinibacteria bacterium]|nr:hypothetical protein [Candidatus Peregrinibacteria bacterium]